MSKQYIAKHDKAMRTVIQAFTNGQCGGHYLVAAVGRLNDTKNWAAQQESSAFVLPQRYLHTKGLDLRRR